MPQEAAARKAVQVKVNSQPITVAGPRISGRDIKQAAIAQGVQIEVSFQLSVKRGSRQTQIVGDEEVIAVHDGLEFVAVAADDNS